MKLFIKWLVCAAALFLAQELFPGGFFLLGGPGALLAAATVFWLLNLFIRPVLQLLALPATLLTFGLFSLVVNGMIAALADALLPGLWIGSFWICMFVSLLISAGNLLFVHKSR